MFKKNFGFLRAYRNLYCRFFAVVLSIITGFIANYIDLKIVGVNEGEHFAIKAFFSNAHINLLPQIFHRTF